MQKFISKLMIVMLIICVVSFLYRAKQNLNAQTTPTSSVIAKAGPSYIYPDPVKTPGATNPDITDANKNDTICNKNWSTKSIRPPVSYTSKLKKQMLLSGYNYNGDMNMKDYELDHLISLEIGGNPTDPKNLWPESYATPINARTKDKVENYLHKQVCNGSITLVEAQKEEASDWYAVYIKISK